MRRLIVMLFLLLLLPIGFGISVQADETEPNTDIEPGDNDGGGENEGDHPWGGDERVVIVNDNDIDIKIGTFGSEDRLDNDNTINNYNDPVIDESVDINSEATEILIFNDFIRMQFYLYFGFDFMAEPTIKYPRPVTNRRNVPEKRSSYRTISSVRNSL